MLSYKAEAEGKVYLEVDKFFLSSKVSHLTGYRFEELKLSDRMLYDPIAEKWLDRDINAAINIKNEGLRILSLEALLPFGGSVRRVVKLRFDQTHFPAYDGSPVPYAAG